MDTVDFECSPVVIGDRLVAVTAVTDTEVTYAAIDPASGDVDSEVTVPGSVPGLLRGMDDRTMVVGTSGSDESDIADSISLLELDADGSLKIRWTHARGDDQGEDEPAIPGWVARAGGVAVGWTKLADGRGLVAYSLEDGSIAWTGRTSSFDNTNGLIEGNEDVAVVTPMGGAWMDVFAAANGTRTLMNTPPDQSFGAVHSATVLDDGTMLLLGAKKKGKDDTPRVYYALLRP